MSLPTTPLWTPAPPAQSLRPEDLPASVDIAVVGGTLEAMATALFLARGGARVALLCADEALGSGLLCRDLGIAALGYAEPPERLVQSVGEERCRELLRFSAESLTLVDELGLVHGTRKLVHASLGDREEADLPAALAVLDDAGLPAERLPSEDINALVGGAGFGPGRVEPQGRVLDPLVAIDLLTQQLQSAGVLLCVGSPVEQVSRRGDEMRLVLGGRVLQAELVVLAEAWRLKDRDLWFEDKLTPVRTQLRATMPGVVPADVPGFSAQLGYLFGRGTTDGRFLFGGCRWATQHLETWETDDTVLSELVAERQEAMLARFWPELAGAEVTHRWSAIMTFTCDNLPLVGPLPGRSRVATVAGFNGRPWSLALRCAKALSDGLLDGQPVGLPAMMRTDRFL